MHVPADEIQVFDLGLAPYSETQELQGLLREVVFARGLPGILLLLEHPPVITLGNRGGAADLRPAEVDLSVPALHSERGGAATVHAPGQLIAYPIMPIPGRNLRAFVASLQEVLARLLLPFGVAAEPSPGRPGLYVDGRKIASVGLRCSHWVSSHGTSLNVSLDLALFDLIVSCGEPDLRQTSMLRELGWAPHMEELKLGYLPVFADLFGVETSEPRRVGVEEVPRLLGLD